jgi:hypothetical protein
MGALERSALRTVTHNVVLAAASIAEKSAGRPEAATGSVSDKRCSVPPDESQGLNSLYN